MMTDGMLKVIASAMMVGAATGGTAWMTVGPRQAEMTTQAMAIIQSLTQTSGSVAARQVLDGASPSSHVDAHLLMHEGYLSALPENPTMKGKEGLPVVAAALSEDGVVRQVVQMTLRDDGQLCDEIQQQVTGRKAPAGDAFPLERIGCVKTRRGPVAYSRI
jgi:hypothetical protein